MEFKETTEFVDWTGDVVAQAALSFADGATADDATDFLPVAFRAMEGLGGFFKAAKTENQNASISNIDELWKRQEEKMIEAGVNPLAAATIISGLKTAHFGFALSLQSKETTSEEEA